MALYAITCLDKPGALDLRLAHRPDHLAYLKTQEAAIRLAGPLLDGEGLMCGSLFVVETADEAAARAFSDGDPFVKQGLFGEVRIFGFAKTLGDWS
jgi:uncharacterized protein YciI